MPDLHPVQRLAGTALCEIRCQAVHDGIWLARLNPQAPEWLPQMLRLIHDALGYFEPNVWIYAFVADACKAIAASHQACYEHALALVDTENRVNDPSVLASWLKDAPERRTIACNLALLEQQRHSDYTIGELLQLGMSRERKAVFAFVYRHLTALSLENPDA